MILEDHACCNIALSAGAEETPLFMGGGGGGAGGVVRPIQRMTCLCVQSILACENMPI